MPPINSRLTPFLLVIASTSWALTATAGEGVLEINQTCAVQTGCFSGDTAGFPVTIDGTAGRAVRLTSDLVVPNENTSGLLVAADSVRIDLAGFEIRGPVTCSGLPLVCAPASGSGSGVDRINSLPLGTSVTNGSVRGMGNNGVSIGNQGHVTNLHVRSNRAAGVSTGSSGNVSGITAASNGSHGISAGLGSTVSHSASSLNGGDGILASSGSVLSGNTAYNNLGDGFDGGAGATFSNNAAYSNDGDGIEASVGSTIKGNSLRSNNGYGLNLGADSGYRENVISNNGLGTVTGTAIVNLGNNACNGSTTCP